MIISRGIKLLKNTSKYVTQQHSSSSLQIRNSSHNITYRGMADPERKQVILAELLGGFAWWWIFWHFYHDLGHVIGEFDYPDPSSWTDEELGIPPDDFD